MKKIKVLFLLVTTTLILFSQNKIDTIRSGIYLKSLYDFNSSAYYYDVDLWMWFNYSSDSLNPLKEIEIANAKQYSYLEPSIEKRGSVNWASQNCKASINQDWDLQHYPFDHQKLEVILEESQFDCRKVILLTDKNNFNYNV